MPGCNHEIPTRDQLLRYWRAVADRALPHLGGRPLGLVRLVNGRAVYHRGPLPAIPKAIHCSMIPKREGGEGVRIWIDDLEGLLATVDMDALELHPWGVRVDDVERPDMLVFNLKPGPEIPNEFVVAAALALRTLLREEGLKPWPKTTGEIGVHIMVPVRRRRTADQAREWTKGIAQRMAAENLRYTLSSKDARSGKLLIDYQRNGHGTTTLGTYSPVARPGLPVSHPITWKQLEDGIAPDHFKVTDFF